MPSGRPSSFTEDRAAEICARLVEGESLKSICRDEKMPDIKTVYLWMAQNEIFLHQYTKAREDQADTLADEILAIAEESPMMTIANDDGVSQRLDPTGINRNRLRVDARKWVASKLKPKKYGDKVAIGGDDTAPSIKVEGKVYFEAILKNLELTKQTTANG
jgi:hypothetical protein